MGGKLTQQNGQRYAGGKPIPKSQFALPGQDAYPIDTVKRARNALSRIAQFGSPAEKAKVQAAVRRRYSGQISVGGQSHASGEGDMRHINLAQQMKCPQCGYQSDDADFSISGGSAGTSDSSSSALQTPQPAYPTGSGAVPLTVRGASSGNMGLANGGGQVISLSRRSLVKSGADMLVARAQDGSALVRHRRNGADIGQIKRNADGTWTPVVDGRELDPETHQRTALFRMVGSYNKATITAALQPPPVQTPLMEQFGVPAIRLAGDDSDMDNDDDSGSGGNGLTPRGQQIYKKLCGKGISPKVAMAMAKRAQNTKPGSFGSAGS